MFAEIKQVRNNTNSIGYHGEICNVLGCNIGGVIEFIYSYINDSDKGDKQ